MPEHTTSFPCPCSELPRFRIWLLTTEHKAGSPAERLRRDVESEERRVGRPAAINFRETLFQYIRSMPQSVRLSVTEGIELWREFVAYEREFAERHVT